MRNNPYQESCNSPATIRTQHGAHTDRPGLTRQRYGFPRITRTILDLLDNDTDKYGCDMEQTR
ncbi:hypothetical protein DPMN_083313 [Dreissena polymorpha]|uniref:Uncharacterized protein n=1 Tax=Dreissena polymorpha TaxID=45954 RepID=A0A9D3Y939_DREPO|nr:hypothetical protein DPMN_083313 [Dreissena polymorpha]